MFEVGKYKFVFQHENCEVIVDGVRFNGFTDCLVFDKEKGLESPEIVGRAYCSSVDTFNKAVGRKTSLTRAVQGFSKEERTEIWGKYFSTVRK